MEKVSIIIPIYNVEKYLRRCLDSIINQTYKNLEIICVNDGSTDGSAHILESYAKKDNRIKVIDKQNEGLSIARNKGLDIATGKYCYFVDSDDWIELSTIEKLVNAITTNDVDVVIHSSVSIAEDDSCADYANRCQGWFNELEKESGVYDVPINIAYTIPGVAWDKLYKMDIIKKYNCRFLEGLINEDELFLWTYMIHCKNYYYLNERLYYYYHHSNSITTTRDKSTKALDIFDILKQIYLTVDKYKNIEDYKEFLTIHYINYVLSHYRQRVRKEDRKKALKKIKEYYEEINHDKRILVLYKKCQYLSIYNFIQQIFSFNKESNHKILTIMGIKIKFKIQA